MPCGNKPSGVETNKLNSLCRLAIDTQVETGIQIIKLFVRDSP